MNNKIYNLIVFIMLSTSVTHCMNTMLNLIKDNKIASITGSLIAYEAYYSCKSLYYFPNKISVENYWNNKVKNNTQEKDYYAQLIISNAHELNNRMKQNHYIRMWRIGLLLTVMSFYHYFYE